jgi:hypothetical protein
MVSYAEYIRSPEWRQKRLEIIRRARGICEQCGLWPVVNVHHLTYERLGNEPLEDLLGLCSGCHERAHGGRDA